LRETPPSAAECNCSICRRTGGLWHHCPPAAVEVAGEGIAYREGDRALDCGTARSAAAPPTGPRPTPPGRAWRWTSECSTPLYGASCRAAWSTARAT